MSKTQEEIDRFIQENRELFVPPDSIREEQVDQFIQEHPELFVPDRTPGFFSRYGRELLNVIGEAAGSTGALGPPFMKPSPQEAAVSGVRGAGLAEGAVLAPLEHIAGAAADVSEFIQSKFPDSTYITFGAGPDNQEYVSAFRAVEDFARRLRYGLLDSAEEEALSVGVSPTEIATARGFGNFVGTVAPIHAAYRIPGYFMNIPKIGFRRFPVLTTLFATLPEHFIAGAMFGGLFEEADGMGQRIKHMAEGSAYFGLASLIMTGGVGAFFGVRNKRWHLNQRISELDDKIARMRRGEDITFTEQEAASLSILIGEEESILSSPAALRLVSQGKARAAITQAIIDQRGNWSSTGIIRNINEDYYFLANDVKAEIQAALPALKVDIVNSPEGGYNIAFGLKGLSGEQKKIFKKTGKFPGMLIQKGKATYEYIGPASPTLNKKTGETVDRIFARLGGNRVVTLWDKDIKYLNTYRETIDETPPLRSLYEEFRNSFTKEIDDFVVEGGRSEADIIRGIREGNISINPNDRRIFSIDGAITHPEAIGINTIGESAINGVVFSKMGSDGFIRKGMLHKTGPYEGVGPWSFVEYPKHPSQLPRPTIQVASSLEEAVNRMQKGGWEFRETRYATPQAEEIAENILKHGAQSVGSLTEPMPYITFNDAVNAFAKKNGIPTDMPEFEVMRAFFGQEMRKDFWKNLPQAEKEVWERQVDDFIKAVNENEIPVEARAYNEGFLWRNEPDGRVSLQPIGETFSYKFNNEASAREALRYVYRSGQEFADAIFPVDELGIGGMTGGWEMPGSFAYFGNDLDPHVFMNDKNAPFFAAFRNLRDLFLSVEEKVGFPLFTQVFDEVDQGLTLMRLHQEPPAKMAEKIFKRIPKMRGNNSRYQLVEDWWVKLEEMGERAADPKVADRLLRKWGATPEQRVAFREARELMDFLFTETGLPPERFIYNYYSRVRPYIEEHGTLDLEKAFEGKVNIPPSYQFWAELPRTGDMAMIEKDPAILFQRYIRSLYFNKYVRKPYERARALLVDETTPRIRDMPRDLQQELLNSNRTATLNDPVLPAPIRMVLSEYLANVRGTPEASIKMLRQITPRFFKALGMEADPHTLETLININMTNMYGAAIGARPMQLNRNMTQNIWALYTRYGSKWGGEAHKVALSREGTAEAIDALALRSSAGGIAMGDAIMNTFLEEGMVKGEGVMRPVATAIRGMMRLGWVSSKVAEKLLIPYGGTDDASRAIAYWWAKLHTEDVLKKYESGAISWKEFERDGLPFFSKVIKNKFARMYNRPNREGALRWISKMASDESNWIYGHAAQPAIMQNPLGRYLTMFGTWPLWMVELYANRMWNGDWIQRTALVARTVALIGAFTNMTIQTGYDWWNWIGPMSIITYSGGPIIDNVSLLRDVVAAGWTLDEKGKAFKRFSKNAFRLQFPGQVFGGEVLRAIDSSNPAEAIMDLTVGRPVDDYNFALEVLYNPNNIAPIKMYEPVQPLFRPGGTR